jgi:hypothetical protein
MKIWERISQEVAEDGITLDSKKEVKDYMDKSRVLLCVAEREWQYLSANNVSKLHKNHRWNCLECLNEYLDMEVQ